MRYADLDPILGELAREGKIKIDCEMVSLLYWIDILSFKVTISLAEGLLDPVFSTASANEGPYPDDENNDPC